MAMYVLPLMIKGEPLWLFTFTSMGSSWKNYFNFLFLVDHFFWV